MKLEKLGNEHRNISSGIWVSFGGYWVGYGDDERIMNIIFIPLILVVWVLIILFACLISQRLKRLDMERKRKVLKILRTNFKVFYDE